MKNTSIINVRIDNATKNKAVSILRSLGITTSQAISLFFKQIIYRQGIPFDIKLPNSETKDAINELEAGKGTKFSSANDLFRDMER